MTIGNPLALWLFPAAVAALLLLQLWHGRRREWFAGSLLIWRRVAAREPARPPRRIVLDPPFWLETATLLAITLALAGPSVRGSTPARRLVLVVDNGPAARARMSGGKMVWEDVRSAARQVLGGLGSGDRVALAATSPLPRALPPGEGLTEAEALAQLDRMLPALSGPEVEKTWAFALEEARLSGAPEAPVAVVVVSPRAAPNEAGTSPRSVWHTAGPGTRPENVAVTAFGAALLDAGGAEVLVQVRNFGGGEVVGQVVLEPVGGPALPPQHVRLASGGVKGAAFRLEGPLPSLRVAWRGEGGTDALPEDDEVTAVPRAFGPPRVRIHGAAPHLEDLYRGALGAQALPLDSREPADLEIYVEALPPAAWPPARAFLLLAPAGEFGPFEVLPEVLEHPVARLGADDPLTRYMRETPEGLGWRIAKARALRQVGDLRVLIQDDGGRPLSARFRLKDGRPAYVLAFVPGEGPRERKLDSPGLAALLVRLLREAAGAAEPYAVQTAAQLEAPGAPLPLSWRPALDPARGAGEGVLSVRASALELGTPDKERLDVSAVLPAPQPTVCALWPVLVGAAILLMLVEASLERAKAPRGTPGVASPAG
jgi:hypothetical protein